MWDVFEAIILGIIQGLTEFLPVSSSGHIELGKAMLSGKNIEEMGIMMTVVLHFATALSTVVYFRKDILSIIKGLFLFKNNEELAFSIKIVLSMIPAAVIGVLFEDQLDAMFSGNVLLVGMFLILTGGLLLLADKASTTGSNVSYIQSFIIGISQAIAILPGISRSGATISTSVLLGVDKEKAARFSFLMVVPLILGKVLKDILDGDFHYQSDSTIPLIAGFLSAFIVGIAACAWMIKLVKNSKLIYFSIYCFVIGTIAIIYGML